MDYPQTRTVDQRDDFHGTEVADPYRWLEDQNSDEVADWVRAQAELTAGYLAGLPGRDRLAARLAELSALPTSTVPQLRGDRWFRRTNDGVQQQAVLRVGSDPLDEGTVLIDPNQASSDGTTALAAAIGDPAGRLVAWSYKEAGSDWCRWRVRDVETGEDLSDDLQWAKFVEPCWLADSTGFVYAVYPADENDRFSSANGAVKLLLHRLGTSQDDDELLLHRPEQPSLYVWPWIDRDQGWLAALLQDSQADTQALWIRDLDDPAAELHELIPPGKSDWAFVGADERGLIMRTDLDAEQGRLVLVDRQTGELTELVAERDGLLQLAELTADALIIGWLVDACSQVTVHELTGEQRASIELPSLGTVDEISANDESSLVHLSFTSFDTPPQVLAYELSTGRTETVFGADPTGERLVTDQIWITSADGTRLPAFVVHRADVTAASGPHSCTLYGYGGFNIARTPEFSPVISTFVEAGGVWVVANLRGGSEYGSTWHDGGRLANKQNVFDDAIATAEQLIAEGWTSRAKLAVNGGSNGGLLVGALVTQRPDLFAAAVPQVGVLDMLRYEQFTIGRAWARDYGIASRSKEEFDVLYAYSPYHRLRPDAGYPPVLLMTSDHDDRVVPAHSFKFAARLQAVSAPGDISYLRVEFGAGHGLGKSRSTLLAERTDLLAFIAAHTRLDLG
ncbi:MAG: prolyl oligopeptidase family serine peptidase [Actinomycetota bacterium]|nr:prolyl oligopeptidase family serine peptidase [Actinomycetota bacterium]MDQ2956569.1 prolyl oligopeptidase family serine peptidase [Actinomycetota bacterium]